MTGSKWAGDLAMELMGEIIALIIRRGRLIFLFYIPFRHYHLCSLFELGKPVNIIP